MNELLIKVFTNLAKQIRFDIDNINTNSKKKLGNMFRLKHINHAIKVISMFKKEILSSDQLKDIKGIGDGICKRIDEIIKTGKLGEVKSVHSMDKYIHDIEGLEEVYGIGRSKAIELIKKYDINNVTELKKNINKLNLSPNIIMGLKYYKIYEKTIPRSEMYIVWFI